MLLAQQSQTFGLRSNRGNIWNLFRFHFGGTNNIGNAKDFPQVLQALNCQGHIFLRENLDSAAEAENMGRRDFRQWEDLPPIRD
jgi:hypothetical protein